MMIPTMLMIMPRTPNIIVIAVSEEPSKHVSEALGVVSGGN
jgi:hypothetical protein